MVIKRPTECINACCGAICSSANYQFNKGIFGDDPKKCPNYRFYVAPSRSEKWDELLDKIRAEISEQRDNVIPCIAYPGDVYADGKTDAYNQCLRIIDKYRKDQTDAASNQD